MDGNRNTITYPDGKTQTYTYEHGRLKEVQLPNGQSMTWDGYQWQRPNQITMLGGVQTLSYDALQRSKGIEFKASNVTLMNRGYTYDAAGNITERQTEDGAYNYEYDQLDRITQATPPQSVQDKLPIEAFTYDAVHNRIGSMQQPGDWQYNADNQLVQFGAGTDQTTYTYTANGHVATKTEKGQTLAYTYDATNRLISIADTTAGSTEIARYAYDPMGRRISKKVGEETTYYLYTDEGLIAELDKTGNMTVAYGWQADTMYGTAPLWQAQVTGSDLQTADYHYLITDHLGTPQLAVNSTGQTTWKAYSEAFGKTTPDATNQITMNLRFPGQYFDQETNTHYNYFRDYDTATGRYAQSDPIGLNSGINVYGYVNANSLMRFDPFGLEICILITRTKDWGIGDHAAISGSRSDQGAWIYDPAGSYAQESQVGGSGHLITEKNRIQCEQLGQRDRARCHEFFEKYPVNNQGFAKYHNESNTQEICIDTTEEQEQAIIDAASRHGGASAPLCAWTVSNVLDDSGVFPDGFNSWFSIESAPGNLKFPSDQKVTRDRIINISK